MTEKQIQEKLFFVLNKGESWEFELLLKLSW